MSKTIVYTNVMSGKGRPKVDISNLKLQEGDLFILPARIGILLKIIKKKKGVKLSSLLYEYRVFFIQDRRAYKIAKCISKVYKQKEIEKHIRNNVWKHVSVDYDKTPKQLVSEALVKGST